jgi:hypothetical protein
MSPNNLLRFCVLVIPNCYLLKIESSHGQIDLNIVVLVKNSRILYIVAFFFERITVSCLSLTLFLEHFDMKLLLLLFNERYRSGSVAFAPWFRSRLFLRVPKTGHIAAPRTGSQQYLFLLGFGITSICSPAICFDRDVRIRRKSWKSWNCKDGKFGWN